jgi:hypothetical protein
MEKKKRGGPRPNSGRPPKIQEIKLIEQMDALAVPNEIWNALLYKCQQGDTNAIKLWLSYRFGLPKQQVDITSNGEKIAPPIQWIGRQVAIEAAKVIEEEEEEAEQLDELQIKVRKDYQDLIEQDKQRDQFDMFI